MYIILIHHYGFYPTFNILISELALFAVLKGSGLHGKRQSGMKSFTQTTGRIMSRTGITKVEGNP
jgi:hypothetical protein